MARQFLACLERQTSLEACLSCFPYDVLRLESSIGMFYEYYDLANQENQENGSGG
jgi:hypothetical protein